MNFKRIEPRLIIGSSEDARLLAPDLIGAAALAVTSPPYHNAISYESHQEDREANYRTRAQIDYAEDYLALMDRVWTECWHLLRPGAYLAVNVGTVLDGGVHFPLPQDIEDQLVHARVEWNYVRSILWNKVTAGVKRAGSVIQHRLPGYWYPNIMSEHIILVQKPGGSGVQNHDVPPEWWQNIWDLAPVPPRTIDHPAPFPEDLPHRLIRMLTAPGDVVVDPFNGAGSTTKAASALGRAGVGFDLSAQYAEYAARRAEGATGVRPMQLTVVPVKASDFVPGKSKGRTRHGAGLATRRGSSS
ncbi:MAG: site-specific DNA-methyltransferase [Actinomycetota bacterium]